MIETREIAVEDLYSAWERDLDHKDDLIRQIPKLLVEVERLKTIIRRLEKDSEKIKINGRQKETH